jgi:hypothetical protein
MFLNPSPFFFFAAAYKVPFLKRNMIAIPQSVRYDNPC